jgi:hypothetical protein
MQAFGDRRWKKNLKIIDGGCNQSGHRGELTGKHVS